MMVYVGGVQPREPRKIMPRVVLEVQGLAYVGADCYHNGCEKTCRLDRMQRCWLA
jgi:hypothetical protein